MKQCKNCSAPFTPKHHSQVYCIDKCNKEAKNKMHQIGRQYKKNTENYTSFLEKNFLMCTQEPYQLTTVGFNSVMSWVDIIKKFGKFDEFYEYLIKDYKQFKNKTDKQNLQLFCREHPLITYRILQSIGLDKILKEAKVTKLRYTEYEYNINFIYIMRQMGRLPLYSEFIEFSKITLEAYKLRFNLKGYDEIVRMYSSDEEFQFYKTNSRSHKSKVAREAGKLSAKYNDKDYEKEFRRVFNFCLKEFAEYPPRRLFNLISNIDESSYRNRYKLSWTNVCIKYGYIVQNTYRRQNVNVKVISERVGHRSIQITLDKYSHVLPSMQKHVADELGKLFKVKEM